MKTSESIDKIIPAIHKVQQEIGIIGRKEKADVGKFSYKYASLSTIWGKLMPLMEDNGLTVMQSPTSDMGDLLTTTIFHSSGQFIQDRMRLITKSDDPQGIGAAISYARRYAITSMFGIVTDDDNDAVTQREATGEMKKDWVRAFTVVSKKNNPEQAPTQSQFMTFMTDVYGKHPSRVLAKEHQQVLDTINAFDPSNK